jgi:hypothetical protein
LDVVLVYSILIGFINLKIPVCLAIEW